MFSIHQRRFCSELNIFLPQYTQYAMVISKIFVFILKPAKANMIENLKVFQTDLSTDLPLLWALRAPMSKYWESGQDLNKGMIYISCTASQNDNTAVYLKKAHKSQSYASSKLRPSNPYFANPVLVPILTI